MDRGSPGSCPFDFPGKITAVSCHFLFPENPPDPGVEPTPLTPAALEGYWRVTLAPPAHDPGVEPTPLTPPALAAGSLPLVPPAALPANITPEERDFMKLRKKNPGHLGYCEY